MKKVAVKIKDWPFEKGERAKLTWIGEPFKYNNKWMFYAYFKGNKYTRKIKLDWASVHFLSVDKYYTDGNLNNGQILENEETIDINLNGVKAEYIEKDWNIWGTGFKDKTKSKTFNFNKNGVLYTIPIIEIIRAVLAPDRFMLNRILEMDSFENYFIYEVKGNKLDIHFTSEYEKKLLKDEKINHLAWILTNSNVLRMLNTIGKNIWESGELRYDFLLNNFNIRARVNNSGRYTRIIEIISLKNKRINVNEINIYHPDLKKSQTIDEAKKIKYVGDSKNKDKNLDSGVDGSTNSSEEIDTLLITHEYARMPNINRIKNGSIDRRMKEDENTKTFITENGQARTVADTGGDRLLTGLEFTSIADVTEKGELEEFINILRLIGNRFDVKSVEIIIGELPKGKGRKSKKFSKLSDGITKRKYAIGKVAMIDDRECSLIEIEREDKALSMLILKASGNVKWKLVYSRLLIGLVDESGNWSNEVIDKLKKEEVVICRIKHINRNKYERANYVYEKIFNMISG